MNHTLFFALLNTDDEAEDDEDGKKAGGFLFPNDFGTIVHRLPAKARCEFNLVACRLKTGAKDQRLDGTFVVSSPRSRIRMRV